MSWTNSLGAGRVGLDSISRNFTNISEKDCNNTHGDGLWGGGLFYDI